MTQNFRPFSSLEPRISMSWLKRNSQSGWVLPAEFQGPKYNFAQLKMQLILAVFTQGIASCNYRNDVMITGNPCPVEILRKRLTDIC